MVPGSHKAELPFDWKKPEHHGIADRFGVPWPAEADEPDSGVWESYGCPAGSIVVFSEAVRHTGAKWTLQSHARNAILLADNHSTTVFHEPKECMNAAVVAALSPRAASTSGREPLEWRSGDQCPRIYFFLKHRKVHVIRHLSTVEVGLVSWARNSPSDRTPVDSLG